MKTKISSRGQTVVPSDIRARYRIEEGDSLVWIDDGGVIRIVPISGDPITTLRGSARGERLSEALRSERERDRRRGS